MNKKNILVCKGIKFYCRKDEDAFFEWLKKIDCIETISGAGRELYLEISSDNIHDNDLRDLVGLFYRYKVNMPQLARFLTNANKGWFYDNKKAFWYKKIFDTKNG